MAEDSKRTAAWACTFAIVCAGELGEDILRQAGKLGEKEDYTIILKALEEFVTPSTRYIEDCAEYFYLKQGDLSISQFQSKAEQLIERMIPNYDASSS